MSRMNDLWGNVNIRAELFEAGLVESKAVVCHDILLGLALTEVPITWPRRLFVFCHYVVVIVP